MTSEVFFEHIQQQLDKQLPFVVYRKPNENLVKAMLQSNDKLHSVKDYSEKGFVFAPFDDSKDAILIPLEDSVTIACDDVVLNDSKKSINNSQSLESDKQHHIDLVEKGIKAINEEQFQKVVVSRCETVELSEIDSLEIYKSLLLHYPTAFVSLWYHSKVGLWLGATPETLLEVEGSRFKTMALAGTQKFEGTIDVIWRNKEKEEQQFVTDFIINSLKPATNNITVSNVQTIKAGNVLHLKTSISGILNFKLINLKQVLKALHPTPAVCGLPKEMAKQFILKNENYNREFYTGFLGELNLQEKTTRNTNRRNVENNAYNSIKNVSNLYVNLRCMKISNQKALIYIGGGITKDSNPEAEWQETVAKAEVMKKVLQ
jgi:isochorismate synthase